MSDIRITRWLMQPFVTGRWALACGIGAVAIPTLIRFSVNGAVTGCEFTPYLPFVLLAAVLLRWWQAGAVAFASAALFSGVFVGSPTEFIHNTCVLSSVGMFFAASAMIISIVVAVRLSTARMFSHADEASGGVVFSMEDGQVWASWYGQGPPVCLGSQEKVGEMMGDFLAQEELAKRLSGQATTPGGSRLIIDN
jgi:hypothetical protein